MRSFEAIPALLLLLLLWFLLGRVHVCKCVCACVCRLVDRQQMIFVLFPRATLTKYQKLIVFKLQKICCLTVWGIRSPKSCCLQGHDPSETFKGNLPGLWWLVSNLWCYLVGRSNTLILGPHIAFFLYLCLHKCISLIELLLLLLLLLLSHFSRV